jgi:uncharacterized protein (TIGR00251 family)
MIAIKASRQAITFKVVVQPRSSKAAIVGTHLDMLKIKLTAAPVDGAANKQCLQLIAKALGLPKSWLSIDTGQTGRQKQIRIQPRKGLWDASELKALQRKIRALAENPPDCGVEQSGSSSGS